MKTKLAILILLFTALQHISGFSQQLRRPLVEKEVRRPFPGQTFPTTNTSTSSNGASSSNESTSPFDFDHIFSSNTGTSNANVSRVNIYAVIVGISNYASPVNQLMYPASDAKAMFDFFTSDLGGNIPSYQMKLLLNENATYTNIISAMNTYFLKAGPNDVVCFYFSGHGGKEGFLATYDEKELIYSVIDASFKSSKAKNKICIADACYAGIYKGYKTASYEFDQAILNSSSSMPKLMACSAAEYSIESASLRHGVFTYYLIQGLKGAANADGDNIITITELYNYVKEQVETYTNNDQNPVLNGTTDPRMPMAIVN
jgi:hypothetical protein